MHKVDPKDFEDNNTIKSGPRPKIRKKMGDNCVEKVFESKKKYNRKNKKVENIEIIEIDLNKDTTNN